ncbi:MAG: flagellin, partial [Treponema sp.]|nr:flagellin [Treponema sp.]
GLDIGAENLQASESRIRDTNMANEMVEFTKDQVLSQAGVAMLAQANQSSQNVLSLLR